MTRFLHKAYFDCIVLSAMDKLLLQAHFEELFCNLDWFLSLGNVEERGSPKSYFIPASAGRRGQIIKSLFKNKIVHFRVKYCSLKLVGERHKILVGEKKHIILTVVYEENK